mmetsp:Transcript_51128/g.84766  ORF Transcript_51128/g.84766 Transcript_51128/m.84766 type:complete len:83 (-) Transcript_51128:395-643(-)
MFIQNHSSMVVQSYNGFVMESKSFKCLRWHAEYNQRRQELDPPKVLILQNTLATHFHRTCDRAAPGFRTHQPVAPPTHTTDA